MMSPLSQFKTIASTVLVALALTVVAFGVMPAHAQQGPALDFSLRLPGGQGGLSFGFGGMGQSVAPQMRPHRDGSACLSDSAVRRGIAAKGYDRVELIRVLPAQRVEVTGRNGNWLYSMRVDRCTGAVDRVARIRRVQGGGFGLQFNFGN